MPSRWLIATIAVLVLSACPPKKGEDGQGDDKATTPRRVPVEVAAATSGDLRATIVSTSTVDSRHSVDIVAEIPGAVVALEVDQGDEVKKGDVLARVQREELDLGLDAANAMVRRLESEVERLRPLHDKGILSRQQLDEAIFRLEEARGEQRRAKLSVGDKRVRAPADGVVAIRYVNSGQQVATGTPLFRVVQPGDLVVHVNLPESTLGQVFEGQEAYVVSDALSDSEFSGKVEKVSPVVDPRTGTVRITIELESAQGDEKNVLRPGMFVKAFIVTDEQKDAVTIPRRAVVQSEGGSFVYRVRDGIARRVAVELGVTEGSKVQIESGIAVGDLIVVLGQEGLKDGAAVDAQERPEPAKGGDGS